jgi:capsular exopolysaccharide synthesis family protein
MNSPLDQLSEGGASTLPVGALLRSLRKRAWLIVSVGIALPALVGFVVSRQPKDYEAHATLVIDSSVPQYLGAQFRDVVDVATNWWSSQETMQTELRVLGSYSQALAVAQALCDQPATPNKPQAMQRFIPGLHCDDPKELHVAALALQDMVRADPIKDSRVVTLTVGGHDPELTALIANTAAQVYAQRNLERRLSQSEGAAEWLGDEYGDLAQQLHQAESALIDFKKKNNVVAVAIEDQQNDLSVRRRKLAEELNTVDVKLIAARAQRDQYAQLATDDPMQDISPGVGDNPVMVKLKELYVDQYAKLLELRGKYLDKHPTVIAQTARVESIRSDIKREATMAQASVAAQYQTLVRQAKDLRAAVEGATHEALQLEQRAIEYNRLKRDFDRLVKLSEQVGGRERETSLAGHLKTNNVRLLDAALVPTAAIGPNVSRAVMLAFVVALLLGVGLAVMMELLDATVKTQADLEKTLGLSFLGLIPRILPSADQEGEVAPPMPLAQLMRDGSKDLYVVTHPKSAVAECCRAIRTNLLFMSPDKPPRSLLITSAGPQEGKTTTAINLAVTLAQSGLRVLLVDTDMRRPRLHKAFGIPATSDGVSRAVVGEIDVGDAVRESGVANLWLLPCGATPPNPAELLHADRFRRIIEEVGQRFDRVIFDSPPLSAVTDAAILARLTDGTVLVAKAGKTSREALGRTRAQLSSGVNLLGCILNDLDLTHQNGYGYQYYSHYRYTYREEEANVAGG